MLWTSIDTGPEDHGPIYNNKPIVSIFYIVYIIIIAFFMVNIFVGFVIVTFQNEGENEFKNCDLDKNQRQCIEFALKAKPIHRYIPKDKCQYKVWWFVTSAPFEYTVFILIMLNTICMALKYYGQPAGYEYVLDKFNLFFCTAFAIEVRKRDGEKKRKKERKREREKERERERKREKEKKKKKRKREKEKKRKRGYGLLQITDN